MPLFTDMLARLLGRPVSADSSQDPGERAALTRVGDTPQPGVGDWPLWRAVAVAHGHQIRVMTMRIHFDEDTSFTGEDCPICTTPKMVSVRHGAKFTDFCTVCDRRREDDLGEPPWTVAFLRGYMTYDERDFDVDDTLAISGYLTELQNFAEKRNAVERVRHEHRAAVKAIADQINAAVPSREEILAQPDRCWLTVRFERLHARMQVVAELRRGDGTTTGTLLSATVFVEPDADTATADEYAEDLAKLRWLIAERDRLNAHADVKAAERAAQRRHREQQAADARLFAPAISRGVRKLTDIDALTVRS